MVVVIFLALFFILYHGVSSSRDGMAVDVSKERLEYMNNHLKKIIDQQNILIDSLAVENLRFDPETIWLARGINSETDDSLEMVFVGKVIRNRVEMNYRGMSTYKDVVLDPWQFSAFNLNSNTRYVYLNKSITNTRDRTWQMALKVAHNIRTAPHDTTFNATHFYSKISMIPPGSRPNWASVLQPVPVEHINEKRFLFFTHIQ